MAMTKVGQQRCHETVSTRTMSTDQAGEQTGTGVSAAGTTVALPFCHDDEDALLRQWQPLASA